MRAGLRQNQSLHIIFCCMVEFGSAFVTSTQYFTLQVMQQEHMIKDLDDLFVILTHDSIGIAGFYVATV